MTSQEIDQKFREIAAELNQGLYDSTYHPGIGETWIYRGQPVQITGGSYWGRHGICNHWQFRYKNPNGTLGAHGSTYDNDRTVFYCPRREPCQED